MTQKGHVVPDAAAIAGMFRRHWPLFLVLALLVPGYAIWVWGDAFTPLGTDALSYLMMAQAYAHPGQVDPVIAEVSAHSRFPPLYPLILALSGVSSDLGATFELTAGFLIAGLVALHAWLRVEGIDSRLGAVVLLIIGLLPQTYLIGLSPQSEFPYLFFSVAALALLAKHEQNRERVQLLAAAFLIALAALTRTIGFTLFVPLGVRFLTERRTENLLALVIAVAPVALWHALHHAGYSYSDVLRATAGGDPIAALWRVGHSQFLALRGSFAANFIQTAKLIVLTQFIGVAMLIALVAAAARRKADGIYVLCYLAVLLEWPFPEDSPRLMWPVIVVGLARLLIAIEHAPVSTWIRRAGSVTFASATLVMLVPTLLLTCARYSLAADEPDLPYAAHFTHWYTTPDARDAADTIRILNNIVDSAVAIPQQVPAEDCVISTAPDVLAYWAHRRSVLPPPPWVSDAAFAEQLERSGCRYIFMISVGGAYGKLMYPARRLGANRQTLALKTFPPRVDGRVYAVSELDRLP